jgi:hypothetical protein
MNITSDKLYRLSLLVLLVLAVVQIYNYMYKSPAIIETKEHMNPALLTHQYEDLASKPDPNNPINYYVKENRFNAKLKLNPTLLDPIGNKNSGIKCGPKMDWDTDQIPGANNVYGDLIWHKTSPKMVLESKCMNCNDFSKGNSYNEPSGVASGLTSGLGDYDVVGALSDQHILNDHRNLNTFVNKV